MAFGEIDQRYHKFWKSVGGVLFLVISVDVRSYFTGIALLIIPTTNTTQNFTNAWKK